ncbi:sugar ABC transporter permease [Mesorhizobium sp. BR1-1-16]|uniref:carbohydrate ABC transporter permease n=1 Tax=Mesorhizobium sp. BR1-1-16 TaxID=2876653 RepID=UPI001CCCEC39|nr:sugar ABC transporter permease [Mesorhizobium sp. BR1-1-16]MBZ9938838.1 sugar ABC transporter permease [Mesorhizobium sp. BR1-1-16]
MSVDTSSMTVAAARTRPRRRMSDARTREWIAAYLFILPDTVGLILFVGLPMLFALIIGVFDVNGFGSFAFVGLANYRRMAADPLFWHCLRVTAIYVVLLVPSLYVAGLGLALLVQRTNRFNAVMRSMFFAPQMVSLVVIAVIWQFLSADKIGLFARIFSFFGISGVSLLGNPSLALITTVFVTVWFLMGFYMMIFLGGLQDIPRQYYEAATIDGAAPRQQFWHITMPLLRPTSFFVLLVSLVAAVAGSQAFDLIYVMTRGGPANATSVMITYIYQQAFQYSAFGYAAAMSSILVIVLMLLTGLLFFLTRGGRFDYE